MIKKNLFIFLFTFLSNLLFAQVDTKLNKFTTVDSNAISTKTSEEDLVYEFVERMPEFPGGEAALSDFLAKNLKHPKNSEDGRVVVNFIVEKSGSLTSLKVIRKPEGGELLAEEVIRVVNKMPNWTPGSQNGKLVRVSFSLPISFHTH